MITEEQFERLKKYLNEECLPAGRDTQMVQKVYSERLLSAIHGALVKKMDDNLSAWQLTLTEPVLFTEGDAFDFLPRCEH